MCEKGARLVAPPFHRYNEGAVTAQDDSLHGDSPFIALRGIAIKTYV
jgi:hypothetical protein